MNGLTNFCWYDHLPKSLSLPDPRGRFENIPRSLKRFLSGRSSGFTSSNGAPSAGNKQAAWKVHSWLPILTVTWPLLSTARTRPTFPHAFQWQKMSGVRDLHVLTLHPDDWSVCYIGGMRGKTLCVMKVTEIGQGLHHEWDGCPDIEGVVIPPFISQA